ALFALWYSLDRARLVRFAKPVLLQEIKRKLYAAPCRDGIATADSLSLIGVALLFGLDLPPLALSWITDGHVVEALATREPTSVPPELGVLQAQVWLGIREVATKRYRPLRIAPKTGEIFRELWRGAEPENEKLKRLNEVMIGWLDRCARAGWQLV